MIPLSINSNKNKTNCIKSKENAKDKIKGKTLSQRRVTIMIKKIAWETFKNTGDINAFMELKQIEDMEKKIQECSLKPFSEEKRNNPFSEK